MQEVKHACSPLETDEPGFGRHFSKQTSFIFCGVCQLAQSDVGSPVGKVAHLDEHPGVRGVRLELHLAHDRLLDRTGVHGGSCGLQWARRKGWEVWLLAMLPEEINDGIGAPRKSKRAVAVLAPCTSRLRFTLGRTHPLSPTLRQGHSSGSNLGHWLPMRRGSERQAADPGPQIRVAHAAEKEAS